MRPDFGADWLGAARTAGLHTISLVNRVGLSSYQRVGLNTDNLAFVTQIAPGNQPFANEAISPAELPIGRIGWPEGSTVATELPPRCPGKSVTHCVSVLALDGFLTRCRESDLMRRTIKAQIVFRTLGHGLSPKWARLQWDRLVNASGLNPLRQTK